MSPFPLPLVRLNSAGGEFICQSDWCWHRPRLSDYDLWLVTDGAGTLERNGVIYELGAGDCFLFSPGEHITAFHNPRTPLRVLAQHFDFVDSYGKRISPPLSIASHCHFTDVSFAQSLMTRVLENKTEADFWLTACIKEMTNQENKHVCEGTSEEVFRKIHHAATRIIAHPSFPVTVTEMAKHAGLCPDYFTRLFKQVKGQSPRSFISQARITQVKNLLLHSSHSISRIAELTGYSSSAHLSKDFKKKTNRTPSQFRKNSVSGWE